LTAVIGKYPANTPRLALSQGLPLCFGPR